MGNSDQALQEAHDRVAKRFSKTSLDAPLNKTLLELAVQRELTRPHDVDFTEDMHPHLPNASELLTLRSKQSLLPLDCVESRISLPALPTIVVELQNAIDRNVSAEEMAEIICRDPKLAAAVLSLANSPLYRLSSKVETLSRAVAYIGTLEISSLALGVRLLAMFEDATPPGFPLTTFWKHSLATAVLAHEVAGLCGKTDPERFFVAGLLHDLGRVILFSNFPDMAMVVMALQQERGTPLHKAELAIFDVDHTMIGGLFFGKWGLPRSIVNATLYHHSPEDCLGKEVAEVVYVANQLATALGIGCNSTYTMRPGEEVWKRLCLVEESLPPLIEGMDERLDKLFTSLFPKGA